jgi:hypothetical protein
MSRLKEPAFFHFLGPKPDFEAMAGLYGEAKLAESLDRWKRAYDLAVRDPEAYQRLWSSHPSVQRRGEATPTYLFDAGARSEIARRLTEPKILVVLRNPIDRAYSQYLQYLRLGMETIYDFGQALDQEPAEVNEYWWGSRRYRRLGHYADYLRPWLREYGEERVRIFLFEDLAGHSQAVVREVLGFLGVESSTNIDTSERFNIARVPEPTLPVRLVTRSSLVKRYGRLLLPAPVRRRIYHRVLGRSWTAPPPLSDPAHERLRIEFTPSVLELQELLKRDLSGWLKPGPEGGSADE